METIRFDPKMFISPPYWECPKCNAPDSFGVLMICGNHYVRRCKECGYDQSYPLPKLNKKVIYIDQFAISNMMKALNPRTKAHRKGTLDEFWVRLFKKLHSLCKLQLIICPESGFHTEESLLSSYFAPLKQMYELLSYGVSFCDHDTIKRFQIHENAKNWIAGEGDKELNLDVNTVVRGRRINAWQDKFIISLNLQYKQDWINDIRKVRAKKCEGLNEVFKRWQSEKNKTFDDWLEEESTAFGRITLQIYLNYLKRFEEISTGRVKFSVNDVFAPPSVNFIRSIHNVFRQAGVRDSDIWTKTIEYLTSPSIKNIPFIKISSMLWSALARKAATGGKKEPPNQGMVNDVEFISVLLPYCDAIFIDKECHNYLKEVPLCNSINYGTKVFSLNNKEKFLEYLSEIEFKTSKKHLDKVDEVYGKNWREPYIMLYNEEEE